MISVSFFVFLLWIIEENAPGGGVLARFIGPGVGGLDLLFAQGWGICPSKKLPGFCPGGCDGQAWNWLIHKVSTKKKQETCKPYVAW